MTDREKVTGLLGELGIPFTEEGDDVIIGGPRRPIPESPKLTGYTGFYITFEFDGAGGFLRVGAWE